MRVVTGLALPVTAVLGATPRPWPVEAFEYLSRYRVVRSLLVELLRWTSRACILIPLMLGPASLG